MSRGSVLHHLILETRRSIQLVGPLYMLRRIIVSDTVVNDIKKIMTDVKMDSPLPLCGDMLSIITYCTGIIQTTYEPIQYVYLNPFVLWEVGKGEICSSNSVQVEQGSIA